MTNLTEVYIIKQVFDLIESDDCNRHAQNAKLIHKYILMPKNVRHALDDYFITLCGYSLETLITTYIEKAIEEDVEVGLRMKKEWVANDNTK